MKKYFLAGMISVFAIFYMAAQSPVRFDKMASAKVINNGTDVSTPLWFDEITTMSVTTAGNDISMRVNHLSSDLRDYTVRNLVPSDDLESGGRTFATFTGDINNMEVLVCMTKGMVMLVTDDFIFYYVYTPKITGSNTW